MEHCAHLQLDPGPRASLCLPPPAQPPTSSVHVRADNVYNPLYGSFARLEHGQDALYVPPNGVAQLRFQAPRLPNQTAGTVDVYGLQILDATLTEENTAASALLPKQVS